MANWNAASISVLVVIFIDVILCIISLATDYWSDMEINLEGQSSKMHRGLIRYCIEMEGYGCIKHEAGHVPGYIRGTLAGMSLAFISNIAAFVTMVMWIRHKGKKETMKTLKIATIILLAIGVFWYFVALVVFADNDHKSGGYLSQTSDSTLSWSWGIAILAGMLDILGAVLVLFIERIA